MKKSALFIVAVLALAACSSDPQVKAIEEYLDRTVPQFAPHKVTEVTRRDSAVNPMPELEHAVEFYNLAKSDFENRLDDINNAAADGNYLLYNIAKLSALEYIQDLDFTEPMGWPMDAMKESFDRSPKDCLAVKCTYTQKGKDPIDGVFYFESDGENIATSDSDVLSQMADMFDLVDEVMKLMDRVR